MIEPRTNHYSLEELQQFMNETIHLIKSIDENHLISSGMAGAPYDICRTMDLAVDHFSEVNRFVDVASIHTYLHDQNNVPYDITLGEYLTTFQKAAEAHDQALIIGEYGLNLIENPDHSFIWDVVQVVYESNISGALVWAWMTPATYDYGHQSWDIDPLKRPNITALLHEVSKYNGSKSFEEIQSSAVIFARTIPSIMRPIMTDDGVDINILSEFEYTVNGTEDIDRQLVFYLTFSGLLYEKVKKLNINFKGETENQEWELIGEEQVSPVTKYTPSQETSTKLLDFIHSKAVAENEVRTGNFQLSIKAYTSDEAGEYIIGRSKTRFKLHLLDVQEPSEAPDESAVTTTEETDSTTEDGEKAPQKLELNYVAIILGSVFVMVLIVIVYVRK